MARASLSPPYSEQSPAKRVCEEKGRRNAHSAVFAARRKRNGASFFTPPRTPSKAQRSGFARKKEEGESIMEFSPQGGNGMARTSLLPRPPSKAQRSGFARKKEEGESIMEFSPQGGNGMARTSLLPRPPSKAQRSGFARKKEEGESIMEFSPQGGNVMARTSSDVNRRTQA